MPQPLNYAPLEIPDDHWAIKVLKPDEEGFIATLMVDELYVVQVRLNPLDCRGYRSIVFLAHLDDPKSALNRPYSIDEQMALYKVLGLIAHCYSSFEMFPQVQVLGNNSHSFDNKTRIFTLGLEEPSFLHGHVMGRGDPESCYIQNVPLRGNEPGQLFPIREGYINWTKEEIFPVAKAIRESLEANLQAKHGIKIIN